MLTTLKQVVRKSSIRGWSIGFRIAGRIKQADVQRWASSGNQRVLVIAPHADDEAIGCGGTILKHRQMGDAVAVVYVTDGRGSRALGLSADVMAQRRRQEALAFTRAVDCKPVLLELPENQWQIDRLMPSLRSLIEAEAPDVIYAPSQIDFHPEHIRVANALSQVLHRTSSDDVTVRVYQIHVPLTAVLVNLLNPTDDVAEQLQVALSAFETQQESVSKALRLQRYVARYYDVGKMAEVFWQLTARQYIDLHQQMESGSVNLFRGIRSRPFSDPLAFVHGSQARKAVFARVREQ